MRLTAPDDDDATTIGAPRSRWWLTLILAVGVVAATAPLPAHAQDDGVGGYVTTTTPSGASIDVSGFRPVCVGDAPFISYTIVPVGFTPVSQSATLVIRATDGTVIGTENVDSLSGQIIWPGASVDAAGNATDWPGWRRASDGVSWEPDPTDDLLRGGLTIKVTVEGAPPATATVDYPPDDSGCANPPRPETPCVPTPEDDCDLPTTGGEPNSILILGAATLLAGILAIGVTRRRSATIER